MGRESDTLTQGGSPDGTQYSIGWKTRGQGDVGEDGEESGNHEALTDIIYYGMGG